MYQHIKVPQGGQKISVNADYSLNVPDQPDHSVHRRRRHRLRHHAGDAEGGGCRSGQELWRQAQDPLDGGLCRRKEHQDLRPRRLVARGDAGRRQGLRGVDQGPTDHAGGWWHPQPERGAAPGTRPVCLPAPDPVLQGRAQPGEGAGEDEHGHLPREQRGHLRRHRIRGEERQGEEADQVPHRRDEGDEDPFPRDQRHWHQAGVDRGHRAPGAQGHPVRDRQSTSPR